MLAEIELDVLRYLDRAALEGLQMHSRCLRNIVNRHARSLPLRSVHGIVIITGVVYIRLREDREAIEMATPGERDLEMILHRVNNAFIHRLSMSFQQENLQLPYYLRANVNQLQCQIGALEIRGRAVGIDYGLVDFLGACLKPQVYEMSRWSESCDDDYATLFTRRAFRGGVKHLTYKLSAFPAPDCILPVLFGTDVFIETCAIQTYVDPRPWILKFIEIFETAERGTDVVRSVTLLDLHFDEESPMPNATDPFGKPRRTDVPTPHTALVEEWSREAQDNGYTISEPSVAQLFVFENVSLAKKLEVFAWTLELMEEEEPIDLYYAYLLQVVDA